MAAPRKKKRHAYNSEEFCDIFASFESSSSGNESESDSEQSVSGDGGRKSIDYPRATVEKIRRYNDECWYCEYIENLQIYITLFIYSFFFFFDKDFLL